MFPPPVLDPTTGSVLRRHGLATALVADRVSLTYAELAERVEARAAALGTTRRLVLVAMSRDVEPIITYLGCLHAGHPALLVDAADREGAARLTEAYDPDVLAHVGPQADDRRDPAVLVERHDGTVHDLHPELALLLSTSGSTGSPKLVRLSRENLASNAAAIASYLHLTAADRAITTLPLHYCYGLSVLHSHLHAGAGLVVTDRSVVDPCFWDRFRANAVTSFAGVPHTFELLDRVGFQAMDLPTLRYVTQAGGRMAPAVVRRYAGLARRAGWSLYVMYGQTEATARMAYLPPDLAAEHPDLVGVAIPGGEFEVDPVDGIAAPDGELVYRGPNVMLGYADTPADLAAGRRIDALRTGDVARIGEGGLVEITGRLRRFVKPLGLRIDLDRVERTLLDHGVVAVCTGDDDGVVVATEGADAPDPAQVRSAAIAATGLPPAAVTTVHHPSLPRLTNDKPDLVAITRQARATRLDPTVDHGLGPGPAASTGTADAVRAVFAQVLDRRDVDDRDTFVSLGGDSLSYVEASIRLETVLGHLPVDWHVTPIEALVPAGRRRRMRTMETNVVLRAVAIVLIVGSHTRWFVLHGGAHALLGIAGYNFARFQLSSGRMVRSIARIVIPSVAWIALVAAFSEDFGWQQALLVNGLIGGPDGRWAFWFIEALVHILVVLAVVFSIPPIRRLERRAPFGLPLALAVCGLALRFDLLGLPAAAHRVLRPQEIFWLFALGWAAARARTIAHRLVISGLVLVGVPGLFSDGPRETVVAVGLLALIWVERVPVPRSIHRAIGVLAGASLYIYLVHWEVFPLVNDRSKALALVVSLVAGVAVWLVVRRAMAVETWLARRFDRAGSISRSSLRPSA